MIIIYDNHILSSFQANVFALKSRKMDYKNESEVGGVRATLVLPPNREIDFDCACVCVACVRASERSCVREMIPLWLGSGGEICGVPSLRPGGGPEIKLELSEL